MNIYRRTLAVLKPYWKQLTVASLSASLHAILAAVLVWMAGPLLMTLFQVSSIGGLPADAVTPGPGTSAVGHSATVQAVSDSIVRLREAMKDAVTNLVVTPDRHETLLRFCWLIMLVVVVKNIFMYLQGFFMAFVQQSVVRTLRDQLFEKYQRLSLSYFHRRRTGQVMSRVTNDVVVFNDSIDLSFNYLVTDSIQAVLFLAFLVILSWKLTLLAMVVLPLVF